MATIRVFLLTYQRPQLLRRALASLQAQTFTDWHCELHNDAPDDEEPSRILAEIQDPRFELHQHERNWGAVASLNHAYAGGPEPLLSILEDDNWWEPGFLARGIEIINQFPGVNVVWSNLRLWREEKDGRWIDTGQTVWQTTAQDQPRRFHWPVSLQAFDALHSHGAMICRAAASRLAQVPSDTPLAVIEHTRERLLPGEWLLLPQPLAHFAQTRHTARTNHYASSLKAQMLASASYLLTVQPSPTELAALWKTLRTQRPPATAVLFHLAIAGVWREALLRHAQSTDWLRFLCGTLRHPAVLAQSWRFRQSCPAAWNAMLAGAKKRTAEGNPTAETLWTKSLPPSQA